MASCVEVEAAAEGGAGEDAVAAADVAGVEDVFVVVPDAPIESGAFTWELSLAKRLRVMSSTRRRSC